MGASLLTCHSHPEAVNLLLGHLGGELLSNHVMITRPWGNKTSFIPSKLKAFAAKEFPIYDNDGEHCGEHRIDVVFFCGAGKSTTFRKENFTLGVEVKVTVENLFCDQKIPAYFNRTDYFYIAVPDNLLYLGLMKASQWQHVGVASLNSGRIYKPALRQYPIESERIAILERLLLEKSHTEIVASIDSTNPGLSTLDSLNKIDWSKGLPCYIRY